MCLGRFIQRVEVKKKRGRRIKTLRRREIETRKRGGRKEIKIRKPWFVIIKWRRKSTSWTSPYQIE